MDNRAPDLVFFQQRQDLAFCALGVQVDDLVLVACCREKKNEHLVLSRVETLVLDKAVIEPDLA